MISAIYVREESSKHQLALTQAELVAGAGIVGDRYFGKKKWPGQNLTLIEAESIAAFNQQHQRHIAEYATGRNIITRGVKLNGLVGQTFYIGDIKLRGVQLCDPCLHLGKKLEDKSMSAEQVEQAFAQIGGLRCDVLEDGIIRVGMAIKID